MRLSQSSQRTQRKQEGEVEPPAFLRGLGALRGAVQAGGYVRAAEDGLDGSRGARELSFPI
jgi:hypothetical protein